jgi:preprotein translocase subunit SecF
MSAFSATMMFGVVLVGTYTSVFIASPILIYLGVGQGRTAHVDTPVEEPVPSIASGGPKLAPKPAPSKR